MEMSDELHTPGNDSPVLIGWRMGGPRANLDNGEEKNILLGIKPIVWASSSQSDIIPTVLVMF
jgi:hypothetical protein